jgi:uncharacterized protein (DUF2249 family)
MLPQHAATASELVAHADAAMYQAKAAGKSTWRMYRPEADMSHNAIVRMSWKERIMEALDDLPDGDVLEVRIHRQPHPLYEVLRNHGYVFTTDPTPDGVFLIRIRKV